MASKAEPGLKPRSFHYKSTALRIQNNDSEDDPGPWKKNGGKDQ